MPDLRGKQQICGKIVQVQTLYEKRLRVFLSDVTCANGQDEIGLQGSCSWIWENASLLYPLPGQKVCIHRQIRHNGSFANNGAQILPGAIPQVFWRIWSDKNQGEPKISGEPYWYALLRQKISLDFLSTLTQSGDIYDKEMFPSLSQGQAMIVALLFGDKRFLNQSTANLFSKACLAHTLALSGQHLAVAGIFAMLLLILAGYVKPALFLWLPARIWLGFFTIPLAILYLWIGGAPASLIRATVMLLFVVALAFLKINFSLSDILALALAAILVLNPSAIFDMGLQMSVLCIFIICLASQWLIIIQQSPSLFLHRLSWLEKNFLQILLISFIIQFALLPLSLPRFNMAGIWFFMNLIWLPLLGLVVLPLAAGGLILCLNDYFKPIAGVLLDFTAHICTLFVNFLNFLEKKGFLGEPMFLSPHWSAFLAFILILFAFTDAAAYKAQNRKKVILKFFLAALILLAVGPGLRLWHSLDRNIYVEALDVGQAQSILLRFPGNNKVIIDGGGSKSIRFDPGKSIIAPLVNSNAAPRLNTVINTHPDLDHLGGLFYLLDKYSPALFHNGRQANSAMQKKWEEIQKENNGIVLSRGDKILLGDPANNLALEVLHPPREEGLNWQGNSASLVLRLTQNGKGLALFTGDAEKDTLKSLTKSGQDLSASVLFAPHHGSDRSLYGPFYNKARPEVVLVNCGYENRWNYPGKNLTKFLEAKKIPVYDTGNFGKITVRFQQDENGDFELGKISKAKD